MVSTDTISFRITKGTYKAIERWRKKIADICGIDIKFVTKKQGEIALRLCSQRGSVKKTELRDIMLGKIR